MSDAIGSKITCKTFSNEFFDWRIQSKKSSFSTGSASRNSQSKKAGKKDESIKPFSDCVRKPDLGFSRKRPFSTGKSDCIRNGLSSRISGATRTRKLSSTAPNTTKRLCKNVLEKKKKNMNLKA